MDKKFIGVADINDILLSYQDFLVSRGSKYVDMMMYSGKYIFPVDSRYPVKVGMTNKECLTHPVYPFYGVEEFLNMVLVYTKHSQDGDFFRCVNDLEASVSDIKHICSIYSKSSWRSILEEQLCLFGETMHRSDELYVETLIKNVLPRLPIVNGLFNEELISYVSSSPEIHFYTYGSVYKLYYLRDKINFTEE